MSSVIHVSSWETSPFRSHVSSLTECRPVDVVVFVLFCMNSFISGLLCDTSAFQQLFTTKFNITGYWLFLLVVVLGVTPGMVFGHRFEGHAIRLSAFLNLACSWVRYVSLILSSCVLFIVSVVLCGIGASFIMSFSAQVSERRFLDKRVLTTSLMIQARHLGWAVGVFVLSYFAADFHSLEELHLIQSIFVTLAFFVFLLCYKPKPKPTRFVSTPTGGFSELARLCRSSLASFSFMIIACGGLSGIGYALPSILFFVLENSEFPGSSIRILNLVAMTIGASLGIALGCIYKSPLYWGRLLKLLFSLCAVSVGCMSLAIDTSFIHYSNKMSLFLLYVLCSLLYTTSFGFMGIGIEACALHPVSASYVCWAIQIPAILLAVGLTFVRVSKHYLDVLLVLQLVLTVMMLISHRRPPPVVPQFWDTVLL